MTFLACRPLTIDDLPAALDLDQACFGGFWSKTGYEREIHSPNSDLLILEASHAPDHPPRIRSIIGIGCLWAILDEAHITLLGIDPIYRRQSIGRWLLLLLLDHARDRELTHATLEVRPSNQPAITLYQKFGFKAAGERRRYYADGENALVLWRSGLQHPDFEAQLQRWQIDTVERLSRHDWRAEPIIAPSPS